MTRLFMVTVLGLAAMACGPTGINPTNCRDGKCTYTFEENKRVRILPPVDRVQIADGDSLVFTYLFQQDENPRIFDDEYDERIYFQIDPSLDSFSFSNAELSGAKMAVQPDCECFLEIVAITNGTLTGTKLSKDRWEITMDVTFDWNQVPQERSFTAEFELETE